MMHTTAPLLALLWRPFVPAGPLWVGAALLAALAVFACVRSFRQRPAVSVAACVMRLVLIGAVTLLLLGPSVVPPTQSRAARPDLALMLDLTASMQTPDTAGSSRLRFAVDHWFDAAFIDRLQQDYNVRLIGFDQTPRTISREQLDAPDDQLAVGQTSHVAASVRQTIAQRSEDTQGAALVVIGDGRDTDGEPFHTPARLARDKSLPVYTVTLGGASLQRDLALIAQPAQPYLLAGEPGALSIRVLQSNAAGHSTQLTVTDAQTGRVIDTREVGFVGSETATISLPIQHDMPGTFEYLVAAAPLPGEVEPGNNKQSVFVEVTAQRLKVLLLEGEPFWDTKFLAHSLRRDERLGLAQVTQIAPGRVETLLTRIDADMPTLPRSIDDLRAYDVVILGKGIENLLDEAVIAALPAYVADHGGRLVMARGRPYDPGTASGALTGRALAVLEPVTFGDGMIHDQALALEPAGRMHPSFVGAGGDAGIDRLIDTLPALAVLPVITRTKPATQVLAQARPPGASGADGQPAVVTMPYGRGMVAAVLGEGLWRWRLVGRRDKELAGVFDRFWSSTVRWMVMGGDYMPGESLSLRLAQRSVEVGQTLRFDIASRAALDPEALGVVIQTPDGRQRRVAPRATDGTAMRLRGEFDVEAPGVHTIRVSAPDAEGPPIESRFNAFRIDMERLHSSADPAAMRTLAELSGGRVLDPSKPGALLDILERYRASMQVPPAPRYVWNHGVFMVLILLWAGTEWLIRKRGGLL